MRYIITLDLLARSKNDVERLLKGLRIVAVQEVVSDEDATRETAMQRFCALLALPATPDTAAEVVRSWGLVPLHVRSAFNLQRWLDGGVV